MSDGPGSDSRRTIKPFYLSQATNRFSSYLNIVTDEADPRLLSIIGKDAVRIYG